MIRPHVLAACIYAASRISAQQIVLGSGTTNLAVTADSPIAAAPQAIQIGVYGGGTVKFKFTRAITNGPNFIVVSPSSGTAPTNVYVSANPNVVQSLPPGRYGLFVEFEALDAPTPSLGSVPIVLTVSSSAPPTVASVVNAASLQGPISPGEVVAIMGSNIGTQPIVAQYNDAGLYPTTLGNTIVTFNDIAAPLLYVSPAQINAVVPYGIAGQKTATIKVTHGGVASPLISMPVVDTSPGIFTVGQNGTGQGAILNDSPNPFTPTFNSVDNPALIGSVITVFATGAGIWKQPFSDGSIVLGPASPPIIPAASASLSIGGKPAIILYAGASLYQVSGMLQVNAIVPDGIASGPQPVVLTVGETSNADQQVTVAVRQR